MRYLTFHSNSYWFQMRVPASGRERFGTLIRVNLQTADSSVARPLSLRLAAEWLTRFSLVAAGEEPPEAAFLATDAAMAAVPLPAVSPAPAKPSRNAPATRLMQAYEYWRDLTPGRPERTLMEFESTAELFDEKVTKALVDLTRADVAGFRDALLLQSLAAATVKKKLGFVSTLLQTQVDAGKLAVNVAQRLRVPRRRVPPPGRTAFSVEQLRAIFTSTVYREGARPRACGGEAGAWLPLLGLATGARLEELCQLRVRDVIAPPNLGLVFRIEDDGVQTRVKTEASRRLVPVHPALLECGFAEYVELRRKAKDEWLFPDLKPDILGSRSGTWSKWFGRYLRSPKGCGIADRRVVFHSFRHLFKTLSRAPGREAGTTLLAEEIHDALTGHTGNVSRGYGTIPLETLVAAMGRISFPVDLPRVTPR